MIKSENTNQGIYTGNLKVYIAEPESRWDNYDRDPYHFGFLDFAIDESLSIEYLDTYTTETTWDAQEDGFNNVDEKNIIAIATVFNPKIEKAYSYPPFQNPFDAHYVDATAAAKPGETGENEVNEDFTHTVFIEEGTAGWCPYCPEMANNLNSVYESGDYPFYFVALITEDRQGNILNQAAKNRLKDDYNLYGYPTSYFDGGKKVLVGGYDEESYYRTRIESCGERDVHELNLSVSLDWAGDGVLDISVTITNNEEIDNTPPGIPTIEGPVKGKAGVEQEYTISSVDPDGDDVYFWVQWYEGCPGISWDGPYQSGEEVVYKHTYEEKGNYQIRVQAKDVNDELSDWGTLDVSMPKAMQKSTYIYIRFLERFPFLSNIINKIF